MKFGRWVQGPFLYVAGMQQTFVYCYNAYANRAILLASKFCMGSGFVHVEHLAVTHIMVGVTCV